MPRVPSHRKGKGSGNWMKDISVIHQHSQLMHVVTLIREQRLDRCCASNQTSFFYHGSGSKLDIIIIMTVSKQAPTQLVTSYFLVRRMAKLLNLLPSLLDMQSAMRDEPGYDDDSGAVNS